MALVIDPSPRGQDRRNGRNLVTWHRINSDNYGLVLPTRDDPGLGMVLRTLAGGHPVDRGVLTEGANLTQKHLPTEEVLFQVKTVMKNSVVKKRPRNSKEDFFDNDRDYTYYLALGIPVCLIMVILDFTFKGHLPVDSFSQIPVYLRLGALVLTIKDGDSRHYLVPN